jgi:hypothetical protein
MSILSRLSSSAIKDELVQLEAVIANGLQTYIDVGQAMLRIKEGKLYRLSHPSWADYLTQRWATSEQQGDRLIFAAQVAKQMIDAGRPAPARESHARPLAAIPEEHRVKVWDEVAQIPAEELTAAQIEEIADRYRSKPKRSRFKSPKKIVVVGKGWRIEVTRKTAAITAQQALESALAKLQAKQSKAA